MSDAREPVDADLDESQSGAVQQAIISSGPRSPDRQLMRYCIAAVLLNIAAVLWAAVHSSAPEYIRPALNFFFFASIGGGIAWAAVRALVMYSFRIVELYVMVLILSLGTLVSLDALLSFSVVGLFQSGFNVPQQQLTRVFQVALFTSSLLLFGGALALRQCHLLKIDSQFKRILAIVSGMIVVPAAAGLVVFPVLILRDVVAPELGGGNTGYFVWLWLVSIAATVVNATNLIRMMTLKAVNETRETKWKS